MTESEQAQDWIRANIRPGRKRGNHGCTVYGLKHAMERDIGLYLDEEQMRKELVECGIVVDPLMKVGIYSADLRRIWYQAYRLTDD